MTEISLIRWNEVRAKVVALEQIDEIFFEASATQTFEDLASRTAFRERWLGRYLENFPQNFYVAQTLCDDGDMGVVAGYLAGCVVDPRDVEIFSDMSCFKVFGEHLDRFPAHLHINLAAPFRGAGLGARLIECFLGDVREEGLCGAHVVTGANSRNVSFYLRCGFKKIATSGEDGQANVFLGLNSQ